MKAVYKVNLTKPVLQEGRKWLSFFLGDRLPNHTHLRSCTMHSGAIAQLSAFLDRAEDNREIEWTFAAHRSYEGLFLGRMVTSLTYLTLAAELAKLVIEKTPAPDKRFGDQASREYDRATNRRMLSAKGRVLGLLKSRIAELARAPAKTMAERNVVRPSQDLIAHVLNEEECTEIRLQRVRYAIHLARLACSIVGVPWEAEVKGRSQWTLSESAKAKWAQTLKKLEGLESTLGLGPVESLNFDINVWLGLEQPA